MLYGVYWDRCAAERLFPCRSQYSSTSRWEIIPFHNLITPKALGTELKKCCSDYKKKMKCQYDVLIPFCLFFLWLYVLFRRWCYFCMKNSNCVEISIWSMLKDFDQEILVIAWQFNIYSPLLGASSIKGIVKPKATGHSYDTHSAINWSQPEDWLCCFIKLGERRETAMEILEISTTRKLCPILHQGFNWLAIVVKEVDFDKVYLCS